MNLSACALRMSMFDCVGVRVFLPLDFEREFGVARVGSGLVSCSFLLVLLLVCAAGVVTGCLDDADVELAPPPMLHVQESHVVDGVAVVYSRYELHSGDEVFTGFRGSVRNTTARPLHVVFEVHRFKRVSTTDGLSYEDAGVVGAQDFGVLQPAGVGVLNLEISSFAGLDERFETRLIVSEP